MPLNVVFLAIATISIVILLNIYIPKYLINSALNKFVKPMLQNKGLTFIEYEWCGLFSHGNFKDDPIEIRFISSKNGNPSNSIYADVYYDDAGSQKFVTIRIDTLFMFIKKVSFSDDSF